ncbi:MAG TPA: 30S ribosomal protein S2 [Desulfurivibrio alkaliphilus]|uniref:Small ribosomal subunit protein uS2 n=1 Tax=Desulfurivibrio alkaliphilus TaxID=427923 RepID=A0A7C2TLF3_9BACT|nr:30S ribosomal protein S2 [Desulfurivibrio alkaliphilus]
MSQAELPKINMREMLEAGLHFGHQTRRWNPKMKPYIFGARNGIYIINLDKTLPLFSKACEFMAKTAAQGGSVLFVGTKRQAQEIIREEATRCGMHFVDHRWLGGMLTNHQTIKKSVDRLKNYTTMQEDGTINRYKKKEILMIQKETLKLERNIGGIKEMKSLPAAIFVVDPKRENIAVEEANRLGIPVVAIADTNCDPSGIDYLIPGNDDAIKSIRLVASRMADSVLAGKESHAMAQQAATDKADEVVIAAGAPAEEEEQIQG